MPPTFFLSSPFLPPLVFVPPPRLIDPLPRYAQPPSFSCSVYLFPSQKSRLTLTLAQYISLLSFSAVPPAPHRLSTHPPPPPLLSSTSFARVYITRAYACCLSLSFVSSSISSCARNVVGRDFLRRGNLSEFIICRNRRSWGWRLQDCVVCNGEMLLVFSLTICIRGFFRGILRGKLELNWQMKLIREWTILSSSVEIQCIQFW